MALRFIVAAGAALSLAACGSDGPSSAEVGVQWAKAVDAEEWDSACGLMGEVGDGCEDLLRRSFAARKVRLLPPGGYQSGDDVTDNKRRFALVSERGGEESHSYYEVRPEDGRERVHLEITVIR